MRSRKGGRGQGPGGRHRNPWSLVPGPRSLIPLLLLLALPLPAQQIVIPLSSPFYGLVDGLYLTAGIAPASSARPWTQSEAALALGRIDQGALSPQAQALYDEAAAIASAPLRLNLDDKAALDGHLTVNLEGYGHSNTEDYVLETDWNYGFASRKPLALVEAEMTVGGWLYGHADIGWNVRRYAFEGTTYRALNEALPEGVGAFTNPSDVGFPVYAPQYASAFAVNFPDPSEGFDHAYPKRADLVAGGANWNLGLYRDRLSWGNGHSGNFIFDNHGDYTDFFRFATFTKNFRFEAVYAFYSQDPYPWYANAEKTKIFLTHRVEFRLFDKLTLAASENVMYYDEEVNLGNFNPSLIFHNFGKSGIFNALAAVEADCTFLPGWNLYAQAALDQATAWVEAGTTEPPAWAVLAGVEWAGLVGPGLLSASLEGAYASPALYRRRFSPDFIRPVRDWAKYAVFDFIGYPYGGDALVFQADAAYRFPGGANAAFRAFYMLHGGLTLYTQQTEGCDYTFPTGQEHEQTLAFTLSGSYPIPLPVSWVRLEVWAQSDLICKWNKVMLSDTGTGIDFILHKPGLSLDCQAVLGLGLRF